MALILSKSSSSDQRVLESTNPSNGSSNIHHSAHVSDRAFIGENTRVWHNAHVRETASIGKNCSLGKDVYVDCGVIVGSGVKIQNGVSLYQGITVEDEVLIGPHANFTNDLRPRAQKLPFTLSKTTLRKGCSVGAGATILCGVTLGEHCMIGAGSVVTEDTLPYGLYIGNPARLKGFVSPNGENLTIVRSDSSSVLLQEPSTGDTLHISFAYSSSNR